MYLVFIDTFRKMSIILLSLPDDFTFKRVHFYFFHTRILRFFWGGRNWFEAEISRDCRLPLVMITPPPHPTPPEEVSRG